MIQIIITHKLYLRPEMKHGKSQHRDHWCGRGNQQENEQEFLNKITALFGNTVFKKQELL